VEEGGRNLIGGAPGGKIVKKGGVDPGGGTRGVLNEILNRCRRNKGKSRSQTER